MYVALPFVLQSISQFCDLCLTAVVSSPCFARAGTGARKKFSRAAPCKERALRHHAAFIQVSVPPSHLVVLFSITLDICTCAGTRTKEAARLQLPNPSTPTCASHVVLPSHRLTPAACTLPPMRSSVWLSLSWPTLSRRNPQRAFAFNLFQQMFIIALKPK